MNTAILIVDDEKDITDSLKRHLQLEGYDVLTTNESLKAIEMIEKNNIKIVISDIVMPELDGVELLRKIKESNGIVQVIMVTGYVTINNLLTCLRYGASNCIFKPFDSLDEISNAVKEAVDKLEKWNRILKKNINYKDEIL